MKKSLYVLLAAVMVLCLALTGCTQTATPTPDIEAAVEEAVAEAEVEAAVEEAAAEAEVEAAVEDAVAEAEVEAAVEDAAAEAEVEAAVEDAAAEAEVEAAVEDAAAEAEVEAAVEDAAAEAEVEAAVEDAAAEAEIEEAVEEAEVEAAVEEAVEEAEVEEAVADAMTVRIALVTDTGGINDQSFNASAWEGMLRAEAELGAEVKYFESKTEADYEPNLITAVDDGYDLVIAVGWMMADTLQEVAAQYPEQKFAIVDNASVGDNVVGINFNTEQCSYLVGVIAGTMTETKNVGFVIGMVSPLMDTFGVGYYAGVLDTCPDCTIQAYNTNSYGDAAGGKSAAVNMYANGADIVYHAAGGTGMGVIDAAKEQGKYAIGVDQDQAYLAPKNVISSAMKRVDNAVFAVISDVANGTFEPGDKSYDLSSGSVDIAPTQDLLTDEAKEAVEKAKAAILAGDIVVPADRDTFAEKYGKDIYTVE